MGAAGLAALLVSVAFAVARAGGPGAHPLYWAGQLTLIAGTAAAVLAPRVPGAARVAALFAFTAAQFVVKMAYAPVRFRFADELQHWRTVLDMTATGRQFGVNHGLPISPRFPGLETVTLTLMRATGLSLHPAAVAVCAASTLLLTGALLVLLHEVTDRPDVLALAALVYLCNPNHGFFTAMYLYATPALPMLVLALAQAASLVRRPRGPAGRVVAGWFFAGVVAVTHHLTLVVCLALLTAAVPAAAAVPGWRRATAPLAALAAGAWALAAAWVWGVAPETVTYLGEPLVALARTLTQLGGVRAATVAGSASAKPLVESVLSLAAILVLAGATAVLAWWAARRRRPVLAAFLGAVTAVEAAIVVIRVVSPRGEELAGRAPAYVTLLVAVALAAGLGRVADTRRPGGSPTAATPGGRRAPAADRPGRSSAAAPGDRRRPSPVGVVAARPRAAAAGAVVVVFVGGITAGWPPYWLRLPGPHLPAGYEAAVDARTMALGWWTRRHLPPGARFVADFGNQSVVGTVGGLDPVSEAAGLFHRVGFDPRDRATVQRLRVRYLVADRRITLAPAPRGNYFLGPLPPGADPHRPLPAGALDKFDVVEGAATSFDDGVIRVYDLGQSRYAW